MKSNKAEQADRGPRSWPEDGQRRAAAAQPSGAPEVTGAASGSAALGRNSAAASASPAASGSGGRLRPTRGRSSGASGRPGPPLLLLAGLILLVIGLLGWAMERPLLLALRLDGRDAREAEIPVTNAVPSVETGPVELVVDPKGGADARSIADALVAAPAGATIRIRPGIYGVSISLDKNVHLLGDPERPQMVSIIVSDKPCLTSRAAAASIRGIALRNEGEARSPCVLASAGRLELEDVAIGSGNGSALAVTGDADVAGHKLAIRDSGQPGVSVRDGGRLVLENSDIEASRDVGISLVNSGAVTLRNVRIVGSAGTGIVIADDSQAEVIENLVAGNGWSGIEVMRSSAVVVTGTVITGNREAGLYLSRQAGGQFTGNRITSNGLSGIVVDTSAGSFTDNEVRQNAEHGIYVSRGGQASLVGNRLTDNHGHGIAVDDGSRAQEKNNQVAGNGRSPQRIGPIERIE